MSKLLLLFLTLVFGLIFVIIPNTGVIDDFFLFSDMRLSLEAHIYFICEKFVLIVLAFIIFNEATEYRTALFVFFLLMVADLIDYAVSYNSVWFYVSRFPVSMNTTKAIIFAGAIINEQWKRLT